MKAGKNKAPWVASLALVAVTAAVRLGLGLAGVPLPDWLVRLLGAATLAALAVLAFTTVHRLRGKAGGEERSHRNGG